MTPELLAKATGCRSTLAEVWAEPITTACIEREITTPLRQAAFLSQIAHESGLFTRLVENLNYSADRLLELFGKYHFTDAQGAAMHPPVTGAKLAAAYAFQPMKIGNRIYANRMGNGDENSGDGYKFRGHGLMELTGKAAFLAAGKALGLDLVANPDLLAEPLPAARSAAWEWSLNNLNARADAGDIVGLSDIINTGRANRKAIGLDLRVALYQKCLAAYGLPAWKGA